jgi:EmrB/QacA subfamily drug resistance transporter
MKATDMSLSSQSLSQTGPELYKHRWKMLGVMCLALVVTSLDTLIVTTALPSMETGLGASMSQLQWFVASYSLAFAAPLLFVGGLADRFGRRLFFLLGMVILFLASIGAAMAVNSTGLIIARAIMGFGAAMIMPSTLALIRHVFPAEERAKAISIWVSMGSLGVPFGPIIGGLLLEKFSWGAVFLINVPLIAAAFAGCLVLIPESKSAQRSRLDIVGLALSVAGPLALIYGIINAPAIGWSAPLTVLLIGGGLALVAAFIGWERFIENPILSSAVFTERGFGGPLITISTIFFGVFGCLFIVTQYLQFTLGYGPLKAGLHMLAMCSVVLIAPVAPKLVERFGLGNVTMFGPLFVAAGLGILAFGGSPSSTQVLIALAALGLGIGIGAPPSVDSIIACTPENQSGAGSAVADVALQFGGALGVAIMGSTAVATNGGTSSLALPAQTGAILAIGGAIAIFFVLSGKKNPEIQHEIQLTGASE